MNETPTLPGFEEYSTINPNIIPDFQTLLTRRITPSATPNGFDPHALMVKKKQENNGESPIDTTPVPEWPEKDLKALEDFCKQHNIMGFKCGRMHPVAALSMLKQKMGYSNVPLEDRVPEGYQKAGTPTPYGPSYPYSKAVDQRVILNG